jgi:GTP cyclohydrolase I
MKENFQLPDVQKSTDGFPRIAINKVGVRNIKVPVKVRTKGGKPFHTIATVSSYCDLVADLKGINMSRISRTINDVLHRNDFAFDNLNAFVAALREAHGTNSVWIKAKFDYLWTDTAPLTNTHSYEPVDVVFESMAVGDVVHNYVTVTSTEMSVCPCSREMSLLRNNISQDETVEIGTKLSVALQDKLARAGFGAHGQKSVVEVKVELNRASDQLMWIEDIVAIIQGSASSPTWSTLKRPDEKYVTEVSYMGGYYDEEGRFVPVPGTGPKFVEDIGRCVAEKLNAHLDQLILDYSIVVNNQESIHSGDILATSVLTAGRNLR